MAKVQRVDVPFFVFYQADEFLIRCANSINEDDEKETDSVTIRFGEKEQETRFILEECKQIAEDKIVGKRTFY